MSWDTGIPNPLAFSLFSTTAKSSISSALSCAYFRMRPFLTLDRIDISCLVYSNFNTKKLKYVKSVNVRVTCI